MYNNLKCSFEGNCQEYHSENDGFELSLENIAQQELRNKRIKEEIEKKEKEEKEYTQKAKKLISQRCILFGWKKGTAKYALCNKSRFALYENSIYMDYKGSYKRAYEAMVKRYKSDENNCMEYGVKNGTPEFNECRIQFEEVYFKNMSQRLSSERREIDKIIYQSTSSSPRHCSSHRVGDSVYTDCY